VKLELRGRLNRIQGSNYRELCQRMPADMRSDWRSAIECLVTKEGKEQVLEAGKVLMGGIAALSINGPCSAISLFSSDISFRPLQLKQIGPI